MTNLEVFGPLVDATVLEQGTIRTLRKWLSTYLAEVESRAGNPKGTIFRPKTWGSDIDVRKMPESQLPALVVVAGEGDVVDTGGPLHLGYTLGVGILVRANTRQRQRDIARLYAAAILGALLHHPDLDGTAASLQFHGWTFPDVNGDPGVVAASAQLAFTALVPNVVDKFAGPLQPDPEPFPPDASDWPDYPGAPTVQETIVTTHPEEAPL